MATAPTLCESRSGAAGALVHVEGVASLAAVGGFGRPKAAVLTGADTR
jgi:hypothetical protein